MKSKPFSAEQVSEFERMTKELSIVAKGVWIAVRMLLAGRGEYVFEGPVEALGWLIKCPSELLHTALKEFELKACGFRVEYPDCNASCNGLMVTGPVMRLVWSSDESRALSLSLNSFRVSKHRESKKESEYKSMPENYELTESMRNFGRKHGMNDTTVMHEFDKYKLHHSDNRWTDKGWNGMVWQKWVLNWVSFGRKQATHGGSNAPKSMVDLL